MEIFTTILTIIVSSLSFGGLFVNNSLTKVIEKNSEEVKQIDVRVNSVPTHQLLKGKADSIQISLKEWQPRENISLELVEIETDEINLNLSQLRNLKKIEQNEWKKILNSPLNLAGRMIINQDDLNNILTSSQAKSIMAKLAEESDVQIMDLKLDLQTNNRIRIDTKAKLPIRKEELLNINLEFTLDLIKGHKLRITDVKGTLNNRQLSSKLLQGFADNINTQLTLQKLEKYGVIARLLKFKIEDNKLEIAGFVHLDNQSP
ncbi:DUF2993 domain-containing protein [Cyanobacterium aponinum UTEX 3221]|uniref:LmeA family phospholipid-binding protein n=1 Tax=Cyanobacterium aponinum TaxID=379064 RepID=UPI002B4BEDA3|nr:DUF2993 domain-containing protein [Cyanobacterium aponinum]WRL39467.1 DUF2993 domain-containing protein [Cyanobacterium aponinum UTEX 3221]